MAGFSNIVTCARLQAIEADAFTARLSTKTQHLKALCGAMNDALLSKEQEDSCFEGLSNLVEEHIQAWKQSGLDITGTRRPRQEATTPMPLGHQPGDATKDINSIPEENINSPHRIRSTRHTLPETAEVPIQHPNEDGARTIPGELDNVDHSTSRGSSSLNNQDVAHASDPTLAFASSQQAVKEKITKNSNFRLAALNASHKGTQTIDEFMRAREGGQDRVLRGHQVQKFRNWFPVRKPLIAQAKSRHIPPLDGLNAPSPAASASISSLQSSPQPNESSSGSTSDLESVPHSGKKRSRPTTTSDNDQTNSPKKKRPKRFE